MNVKTLASNNLTPVEDLKKTSPKKEVKSEASSDRDADGRRDSNNFQEKHSLTEEELQQVLQALKKINCNKL